MKNPVQSLIYPVLLSAGLVACGGGSEDAITLDEIGTASVTAVGQIDGFGSVIVNGVHYDTDDAVIIVNGEEVDELELKVGYLVEVSGEIDLESGRGIALRIEYSAEVEGPISDIDAAAGTITVFGQTILINDDTVLDDAIDDDLLAGLDAGVSIEVSGFRNADGAIVAAHVEVELEAEIGDFQLAGVVSDINLENSTLRINGQEVDISGLGALGDEISEGMRIVVRGSIEGDVLVVDEDIVEDDFTVSMDTDADVELEGIITDVISDLSFALGDVRVRVAEATAFEFGDLGDVREGLLVEVEGRFDDDGVLLADEVQFHPSQEIELEGEVQAIDPQAATFALRELTFQVTEDTRWQDDSAGDERRFSLQNLRVGDFIEVAAFVDDRVDARWIAKRVERFDREAEQEERPAVEARDRVVNVEGDFLILENDMVVRITDRTEFGDDIAIANLLEMTIVVAGFFEGDVLIAEELDVLHDGDNGEPAGDEEAEEGAAEEGVGENPASGGEEEGDPAPEEDAAEDEEATEQDEGDGVADAGNGESEPAV